MKRTKTPPSRPPQDAAPSPLPVLKGTVRWPEEAVAPNEFIQLPKVLLKRFARFGMQPQHLLLLLMLQTDAFENRHPRHYWEELAEWCGRKRNTVRKWGYELRELKLLGIRTRRSLNDGDERRPGFRNERNEFLLGPFRERVKKEQLAWAVERSAQKQRKRK